LKSFIRKEKKKHESMLNELVSFMEECINEWSTINGKLFAHN
jgi:hypothetical protein